MTPPGIIACTSLWPGLERTVGLLSETFDSLVFDRYVGIGGEHTAHGRI
ncbi:hypothetical protein [Sphingomonas sp. TF3]|nr:hypothetical protein [Sphingomonas sp. TF3]